MMNDDAKSKVCYSSSNYSSSSSFQMKEDEKLYLVPLLFQASKNTTSAADDISVGTPDNQKRSDLCCRQVQIPKSWIPLFPTSPGRSSKSMTGTVREKKNDGNVDDGSDPTIKGVIIGRTELLVSVFAECGCSTNIKSSKDKCSSCRQFWKWSTSCLSRQMLQILLQLQSPTVKRKEWDGDNTMTTVVAAADDDLPNEDQNGDSSTSYQYFVSHRGLSSQVCYTASHSSPNNDHGNNHICVKSNKTEEEKEEEEVDPLQWSKNPTRLRRGMIVTVRPKGLEDTFYLSAAARQNVDSRISSNKRERGDNGSRCCHRPHDRRLDLKVVSIADLFHPSTTMTPSTRCERAEHKDSDINVMKNIEDTKTATTIQQKRHTHAGKSTSTRKDRDTTEANTDCKIYFCRYGQDLSRRNVNRFTNFLHRQDAHIHIVDQYKKATHLIISGSATATQVAKTIKLSESRFRNYVKRHPSVVCVTPQWLERLITMSTQSLSIPNVDELWYGIESNKRRKSSQQHISSDVSKREPRTRNSHISSFFLKLSKLYEQCEVEDDDGIRAWKFHKIAGRLSKLDFDITLDTPFSTIRSIGGFGNEIANMIRQILSTGRLERLEEMKRSQHLRAIRDMRAIWGVGKVISSELVGRGFTTIDEVRKDLRSPTSQLTNLLDWKAKIGVEIYEDLLEDMTRDEVEEIHQIVDLHAQHVFPGCQTRVMGSYRRGKKDLGDVDILIVHPKHDKQVPGNVMAQLVENLARNNHLEFHLTELPGLSHEVVFDEDGHVTADLGHNMTPPLDHLPPKGKKSHSKILRKYDKHGGKTVSEWYGSSTYFSVFRSPTVRGRRRRVDIKLYPYDTLPFASLYFTGGKYFNRSMRQWAKSEYYWQLDDRGIKDRRTNDYIQFNSPLKTEQDVFRVLGLVYKPPAERKCFDDVEPLDKSST